MNEKSNVLRAFSQILCALKYILHSRRYVGRASQNTANSATRGGSVLLTDTLTFGKQSKDILHRFLAVSGIQIAVRSFIPVL